jgi:O-methyltransferase
MLFLAIRQKLRVARYQSEGTVTLDQHLAQAEAQESHGDLDGAAKAYVAIFRTAFGYGPAQLALQRIAKQTFAQAIEVRDRGDVNGALDLLVRSIELNPRSGEARAELDRLVSLQPNRDMTIECLVFPDSARATKFYGDAIQTAIDFCVYGGITGDIYEFGVLAGWTAHLFAERMRDTQFFGDLYLFDSFEGLPRQKWQVDADSYDVARGIWESEMALPEDLIAELGMPIEKHIALMLSRLISRDRLHIRKGFFSDSLRDPLPGKAAIVHLDCDLYQSTVEVFEALERDHVLQDGTVLMFDDWNCNRGNPAFGQRRALREFLERNDGRYEVSPYLNYGFNCAAFILHDFAGLPERLAPAFGPSHFGKGVRRP